MVGLFFLIRCDFNNVHTSTQSFFELQNGQYLNQKSLFCRQNRDYEIFVYKLSVYHLPIRLETRFKWKSFSASEALFSSGKLCTNNQGFLF